MLKMLDETNSLCEGDGRSLIKDPQGELEQAEQSFLAHLLYAVQLQQTTYSKHTVPR